MQVFDFDNYKDFVLSRIAQMPSQGRGQFRELAKNLRMHTTLVSQVFRGSRHLTLEQACDLCEYWGFSELESEMFLALVQLERAGSLNLKRALEKQITLIRQRSVKLEHRLPQEKKLGSESQAVFYSSWYYSAIRLITSIPKYRTIDSIAKRLNLPTKTVAQAVKFLLDHGLCVQEKGKIKMGPQRTHLPSDSPLITRHHLNWRVKGTAKMESLEDHEMMFTAPISISEKDALKVRKEIVALIERVSATVKSTKPEKLVCLNIEWFDV